MRYGFDVSDFSGVPTIDNVRALVCSENLSAVAIACESDGTYKTWYDLSLQAKVARIDAYLVVYPDTDITLQVRNRSMLLLSRPPQTLWLDIEQIQNEVQHTPAQIQEALEAAFTLGYEVGIYTGEPYWQAIGNPQFGQQVKLWLAHWDKLPQIDMVNFGGWLRPAVKQYMSNHVSYGLTVDLDVWND